MEEFHFYGQVFGPRLTLRGPLVMNLDSRKGRDNVRMRIMISEGEVDISCQIKKLEQNDFNDAFRAAKELTEFVANLAAFNTAQYCAVVFAHWKAPDGAVRPLVIESPEVRGICAAYSLDGLVKDFLPSAIQDFEFMRILDDLVSAIPSDHAGVINCARAIEGIRNKLAGANSNTAQAWQDMRDALNLDRAYVQLITESSKRPRHGHLDPSPTIKAEVMKRSWKIMNRYLEYRKRKNGNLPVAEFPVLRDE